jgi:hypothetical protein
MDLKQFLLTDEFKEYHLRQAEAVAECLQSLLMSAGARPDIKAAMDMANKLHQLPLTMYDNKEYQDAIRSRLAINSIAITAHLAKKMLER